LKLNKSKPSSMSQPATCSHRDAPKTRSASPVNNKPSEWNCCWLKAVCTAVGTPAANTGKCAKAALNTTLVQALIAPKARNHRAEWGQTCGEGTEAREDGLDMVRLVKRKKKEPAHWSTTLCREFDFHQTLAARLGAK
jgi:hypothetical protein